MEESSFDRATKNLGTNGSRRRMLGGLIGATTAVLAGTTSLGAKGRGQSKAKGKGHAKGKGQNNGRGDGRGMDKDKTKVSFCHLSEETGDYQLITVAAPARRAHENHGDVECVLNPCEGATEPCTVVCNDVGACVAQGAGEEDPVQE